MSEEIIWTKEYKIERYRKMNETAEKGGVLFVGSTLMEMFPVNYDAAPPEMKDCLKIRSNEKITAANERVKALADLYGAKYIDVNAPLKDEHGNLRAEYTFEGMHINEEGYRAVYPLVREYILE